MTFSEQFENALKAASACRINCVNHIRVLICLSNIDHGTTPARLADAIGVSAAGMTGILDTLERQGLIEKTRQEPDRRSYRVYITDRGLEILAKMTP